MAYPSPWARINCIYYYYYYYLVFLQDILALNPGRADLEDRPEADDADHDDDVDPDDGMGRRERRYKAELAADALRRKERRESRTGTQNRRR